MSFRNEKVDEALSIIKQITAYGLIGYPIYHLLFVREVLLLEVIGCGALYYMFCDLVDFLVKQLQELKNKK